MRIKPSMVVMLELSVYDGLKRVSPGMAAESLKTKYLRWNAGLTYLEENLKDCNLVTIDANQSSDDIQHVIQDNIMNKA